MTVYAITFAASAKREFLDLSPDVIERIRPKIHDLAKDPRPPGCKNFRAMRVDRRPDPLHREAGRVRESVFFARRGAHQTCFLGPQLAGSMEKAATVTTFWQCPWPCVPRQHRTPPGQKPQT